MNDSEIRDSLARLSERQDKLLTLIESNESMRVKTDSKPQKKDRWEKLAAMAPIISGSIIAIGGAYFTTIYNAQQLKLQEIQTIEKFIPHLVGDEKSKRAAILAISSLTDAKLAARVASIFASEGTASALQSIAESGSTGDRKIANGALVKVLDNMAEQYKVEKRYEDAIATYNKALVLRESAYGADSPKVVSCLYRLAELHRAHNEFNEAENILRRALAIQKANFGEESLFVAHNLKELADLARFQGRDSQAALLSKEAESILAKLQGRGTKIAALEPDQEEPSRVPAKEGAQAEESSSSGAFGERLFADLDAAKSEGSGPSIHSAESKGMEIVPDSNPVGQIHSQAAKTDEAPTAPSLP